MSAPAAHKPCLECNGAGWVPVRNSAAPLVGDGELPVHPRSSEGCRKCDGNGSIFNHPSYIEPTRECPDCKGTGYAAPVGQAAPDLDWPPVTQYTIDGDPRRLGADDILIARTKQLQGPALWAVRRSGDCLNKSGEWEWEPMPSSRDYEFLERCRLPSAAAAIQAARSHITSLRARMGKPNV